MTAEHDTEDIWRQRPAGARRTGDRPNPFEPAGGAVPPGEVRPGGGDGPASGPEYRLEHRGRAGEIIVLFLINLVLTVLTLGIYRFWGKTRIRRYVWSHTRFLDEPFEYFGTGLELFLGFMFAVVLFGTPILALYLWVTFDDPLENQIGAIFAALGFAILIWLFFTFMYYVAMFAAFRYRVSRTRWHGIKGGMQGYALLYGLVAFGLGVLNGMSILWTKPWADTVVFQYRLSRMWLGDRSFRSTITVEGLYGRFALAWIATFVGGAILARVSFGLIAGDTLSELTGAGAGGAQARIQIAFTVAYLMPFVLWQLSIPWYKAALLRNIADGLEIDGIRFRAEFSGWQLWLLTVPNFFMLVATFGLAAPYVVLRTARFATKHLRIIGDVDMQRVEQVRTRPPRVGEGLLEFISPGMI